jgi:glycosyltransferase involved in cell wall biosynthesis
MTVSIATTFSTPLSTRTDREDRWQAALSYFRERKSVVFVSYCRYWEKHAFVQQSLARYLVENGVRVTWLDGSGWRPYRPTLYFRSRLLEVRQLGELPGRRFPGVRSLSVDWQAQQIKKHLRGRHPPVLWVQGGIDESLAEKLPYIDVFSTFDDPYRHDGRGPLVRKAHLVLAQNSYTEKLLHDDCAERIQLALPPIDMANDVFDSEDAISFPAGFPKKVLGYVGSFFQEDYDLVLFEQMIRRLPDYGFVLMGRTGSSGQRDLQRLSQYSNFLNLPWVPRAKVASVWKKIRACLLLYRPDRTQDGAFPTKVVEASYFGVPCLATKVPKTLDLEGFFPRVTFFDELRSLVETCLEFPAGRILEIRDHFLEATDPKFHLTRVSEALDKRCQSPIKLER